MKTILIIIGIIIMLTSVAYSETVGVKILTEGIYRFTANVYDSLESEQLIETTEELKEGDSLYWFELEEGNVLLIYGDFLQENILDYGEISDLYIRTSTASLSFSAIGNISASFIMVPNQ